jgi:ABC-type dipeptide/oligopeptide/nickel transport system ATPase component
VYKCSDSLKNITAEVFRKKYTVAKKNQSFNNFEDEINVQELNGEDMGRIFHSANACINIVNHIGNEMRNTLLTKMINSRSKIL